MKDRMAKKRSLPKIVAAIFVNLLVLGGWGIVMAQSPPVVTVGSASGVPGDTVTIDIAIDRKAGMAGGQFDLHYDPRLVVATKADSGAVLSGFMVIPNLLRAEEGRIRVAWAAANATTAAGTMLRVTFSLRSAGEPVLGIQNLKLNDINGRPVQSTARDGKITVTAPPMPAPPTAPGFVPAPPPVPVPTPPAVERPIVPGQPAVVEIRDVVSITVTAGAIAGDAPRIAAQVMPAAEAAPLIAVAAGIGLTAASEIVVLTMTGGEFRAPVQLTLNFNPARVPAGQVPAVFVYNERTGRWIYLGGIVGVGRITVSVDRFSKFAVLAAKPLPPLTDIADHWARSSITTLAGMDIVAGFPDGTFRPDANVTRAQFVTLLTKALGLRDNPVAAARFRDTTGHWARGAIGAAAEVGLVTGYNDGTFLPDRQITRAEIAVIFSRVIERRLVSVRQAEAVVFADAAAIPGWALEGIRTAVRAALVRGFPDRTFRPGNNTTRAEATVMLYRLVAER